MTTTMPEARSPARIRQRARILGTIAVVTIALAGAALGNLAGQRGILTNLDRQAYDLCFEMTRYVPARLAPRLKPAPITIVWIDQHTDALLNKPRILWPAEFGEVLRAAAAGGATKIGLDHFFEYAVTGWDEAADLLFLQAYTQLTAQHVPLILAYELVPLPRAGGAAVAAVPVYGQAMVDYNTADARLTPDSDGVVRHLASSPFNPFSSAVVQPGLPTGVKMLRPWQLAIRYYGPPHATFTGVSTADVLQAGRAGNQAKLSGWFNARIVLIGADDALERTPYGMMSNVEVQANAISTIMRGDTLKPAQPEQQWTLLIAAAFLAVLAAYAIRWPFSLPLTIVVAAAAFGVVLVGHARGIVLPIVPAELAILIATAGGYGARLQWRDRRRELLEGALAGRVSPEVLEIMLAGALPLESEIREITVMLCNVHGFIVHSEGRDPQAVTTELNEYFGQMAECILRHGGMVAQYAGDRVLALFGSPARYHDHARRAVVCAMEMLTRMDLLNERRTAAGLEQWRIGIGIHSGEAVLGFLGDRGERLEYAANGDVVTVASRVESLNQEFGTQILLSMATRDQMGLDIATTWKGTRVMGEGKDEEAVYTV